MRSRYLPRFVPVVVIVLLLGACGGSNDEAADTTLAATTTTATTSTTVAPATTLSTSTTVQRSTTSTVPVASTTEATSTVPEGPIVIDNLVGIPISPACSCDHISPAWAIDNVKNEMIELFVNGQQIDRWPYDRAAASSDTYGYEILIVGSEPHPYFPGEYALEVEGVVPAEPEDGVTHDLEIWTIRRSGELFTVATILPITRTAHEVAYEQLLNTSARDAYGLCEVDVDVATQAFVFYDRWASYEIERMYPPTLAFTVTESGEIEFISSDAVACVLQLDPGEY